MLLKRIIFIVLAMLAASAQAEVLATARTASWQFSVEDDGSESRSAEHCELVAKNGQKRLNVSLSKEFYRCYFWGKATLTAADAADGKSTLVFLEAGRGGDGDHTGPIVAVYTLSAAGFRELGEEELFGANYVRQGGEIVSVTGKVLFTFAFAADGRGDAGHDDIFVPAVLTPGCGGICVKSTASKQEETSLIGKFNARKAEYLKEARRPDSDVNPASIESLEKEFRAFLNGQPMRSAENTYVGEKIDARQGNVPLELISTRTLVDQGNPTRYSIKNLFDGNPATPWATRFDRNTNDIGEDGLFKIVFKEPVAVKSLTIWNGLQSNRKLFLANQRIETLEVGFVPVSGKPVYRTFELKDGMGKQEITLQSEGFFSGPEKVKELVFAVHGIHEGAKYKDLCISEIAIGF